MCRVEAIRIGRALAAVHGALDAAQLAPGLRHGRAEALKRCLALARDCYGRWADIEANGSLAPHSAFRWYTFENELNIPSPAPTDLAAQDARIFHAGCQRALLVAVAVARIAHNTAKPVI